VSAAPERRRFAVMIGETSASVYYRRLQCDRQSTAADISQWDWKFVIEAPSAGDE